MGLQTCKQSSGTPETCLQVCKEQKGVPEDTLQVCKEQKGAPERCLQVCKDKNGWPVCLSAGSLYWKHSQTIHLAGSVFSLSEIFTTSLSFWGNENRITN